MRIALLGDMAFLGAYSLTENSCLKENLTEISEYLSHFDYVVGNLETPFSQLKHTYGAKSAFICADKENVEILKFIHVDAVTLANNHMFDYGQEGYELTKKTLNEAGVCWFGSEGQDLFVEKAGGRVAFGGYCCYTSNPLMCVPKGKYGVNAYNIPHVQHFIEKVTSEGYLPILAIHAGLEHVNYPSIDHVRSARELSKSGRYVYYGHHPHVIQGVEEYNGSLIAHSLGNFCFDDIYTATSAKKPLVSLTENNRTGIILELEINGNFISGWNETAFYIGKTGKMRLLGTVEELEEYNQSLLTCLDDVDNYNARRTRILADRESKRKSTRNVMWYIKRLKPRYALIMFNARRNAKEYNNNVLRYINND